MCASPSAHAAAQAQHEVKGGLLLDVVVLQSAPILELFAGKDEALLVGWDALLVLDLRFHVLDTLQFGVRTPPAKPKILLKQWGGGGVLTQKLQNLLARSK